MLKLRAAGVDVDADRAIPVHGRAGLPGLRGSEDVLGTLLAAINDGRVVTFGHRPTRTEDYTTRTVEPWGVVTQNGRWYLVGHDRDRDDTRTFRLSRIAPDVTAIGPAGAVARPEGVDLRELVARVVGDPPASTLAGRSRVDTTAAPAARPSARITAAKAMVRLCDTCPRLPSESPSSAGPMGIIVATSPSMGATRATMRGASSSLWAYRSRASSCASGWPRA